MSGDMSVGPGRVVRVIRGESSNPDEPIELQLGGYQRYWVHPNDFFGTTLESDLDPNATIGIVYDQIEDASNPFGSIYSTFLTLEQMGEVPGTDEWNLLVEELEIEKSRQTLVARLTELVDALDNDRAVFLGLNLEKFKSLMVLMMDNRIGIERVRIPQGSSAHQLFEEYQTEQAKITSGKNFFYYPDGASEPKTSNPLSEMKDEIGQFKDLPPQKFIAAIFRDLLDSAIDSNCIALVAPRFKDANAFSLGLYQKFFAIVYAIRTNLEEDRPVLLAGIQADGFTLREIKSALEEVRKKS